MESRPHIKGLDKAAARLSLPSPTPGSGKRCQPQCPAAIGRMHFCPMPASRHSRSLQAIVLHRNGQHCHLLRCGIARQGSSSALRQRFQELNTLNTMMNVWSSLAISPWISPLERPQAGPTATAAEGDSRYGSSKTYRDPAVQAVHSRRVCRRNAAAGRHAAWRPPERGGFCP